MPLPTGPRPWKAEDIELSIRSLPVDFPATCTVTHLPKTNSVGPTQTEYSFLKIGKGTGANRPAMLVVAGLHAREYAPPDFVLTFAQKLLTAYANGAPFESSFTDASGTVHNALTVSKEIVKIIVENMDLFFAAAR